MTYILIIIIASMSVPTIQMKTFPTEVQCQLVKTWITTTTDGRIAAECFQDGVVDKANM